MIASLETADFSWQNLVEKVNAGKIDLTPILDPHSAIWSESVG